MLFDQIRKSNKVEYYNFISHFIGLILAMIGMFILVYKIDIHNLNAELISILIFSFSTIVVYVASSLYHYKWNSPSRRIFRTIDHIAIFFLIAGTYTPFTLITFEEDSGLRLLYIIWGLAFAGSVFKLFFTGRFENLSIIFYVLMGWTVLIELDTFVRSTPEATLRLLVIGGFLYCAGVVFYRWKKKTYHHLIWHLFVMAANFFHWLAVLSIIN